MQLLLLPLLTLTLAHPLFLKAPASAANSLSTREEPSPAAAAANSTGTCSSAVMALASGIQSNIADQNNELATVTALGDVLAQNPMDMTLYAATQASLMGFVTKGIAIRENNQKIAPAGNAAIPGLVSAPFSRSRSRCREVGFEEQWGRGKGREWLMRLIFGGVGYGCDGADDGVAAYDESCCGW